MADEENEEPKKKSGLVKILIFVFAGILLIAVGLGVGYFMFGSQQPDPSEEIDAIIEKTKEEILEHLDSIAYKTFTNKFNKAYAGKLHEEQQQVVSKYIYSVSDNGVSLKSYLNEEVSRLKERVTESLKMEEVTSDPNMVEKTQKVLEFLESLKDTKLDETVVKKIMQVQSLIREIESNE